MSYVYSLVSGLLFGIGYGLLGLKSPAPPLIALAGLLGMLGGDQLVSHLKEHLATRSHPPAASAPASTGANAGVEAPRPTPAQSDQNNRG
jgi:XapX domain-containing protein